MSALLSADGPRDVEFVTAAEMMRERFHDEGLGRRLRTMLRAPALDHTMESRRQWLRGIPFRAILTTNFGPVRTVAGVLLVAELFL